MPEFASQVELFQLVTRILCDTRPEVPADAICIFVESAENETVVIESAERLWKSGIASNIALSEYPGCDNGGLKCSGYKMLVRRLISRGVSARAIHVFPLSSDLPACTDAEARGLTYYSESRGWKNLVLTTPPMHQFRGMVSLVSAIVKASADIWAWSVPADARDYSAEVMFSQSAPRDKRVNLLASEIAKVILYFRNGDHLSASDVLSYFSSRDQWGQSRRASAVISATK
jgi:hypothetical protein